MANFIGRNKKKEQEKNADRVLSYREQLRDEYRQKRRALEVDDMIKRSVDITNNFLKFWMFHKKMIHCFLPIHRLKEIDTIPLIKRLQQNNQICIPVSNFNSKIMTAKLLTEHTQFQDNQYGIPEPVTGEDVSVEDIDVVIVPLLVVDQHGNRLGYGKGFYDRFLAECKPGTMFIGLSMFGIHEDLKEVSPHDVPLHYVVTPEGIQKTEHGKELEKRLNSKSE
ncbi:MAG: 5-formyltetrahydrofolate cyclo-ligase [Brumimicrobium sp.]